MRQVLVDGGGERPVGEADRGADLAPPVGAAVGLGLGGGGQLARADQRGPRDQLRHDAIGARLQQLHGLRLVPAQEDRVVADRVARQPALDDGVGDVLGRQHERGAGLRERRARPPRRAPPPTSRSRARRARRARRRPAARARPSPAAAGRRAAPGRSATAAGRARGRRESAGSPRAGPARTPRRRRSRAHDLRRMLSISPGRTSASFGPSLSPRCMYICRIRSEVVTDACRSSTSTRPQNSSSARWSSSL